VSAESSANVVCAILAAGRSERMGAQKLLLPVGEVTLLERAIAAAGDRETVVVVAPALAPLVETRPNLTVIVNDQPERGMTHSLALADASLTDRDAALVVLLADTPFVDTTLVRRILNERGDADVAYPVRAGVGGHPVIFGAQARAAIAALKEGDTLRSLRDDSRWNRVEVAIDDDAPFLDVDTPEDLARAGERFSAGGGTSGRETKS
jgi:molybdenum cofactor cytidylyltransferase